MAETVPIGLPWNAPLIGEPDRSIFAPPRYRLTREPLKVAPAASEIDPPLTVEEVVLHLRLAPDAKDGPEKPLLEGMIAAAGRHLENYAGVTLMRTGWRMTMRHFPPVWNQPLDLPMPPFVKLVAISVAGQEHEIDAYAVELDDMMPARLYPKSGYWTYAWSPTPATIAIHWLAGYAKRDEIPATWRQAMLMAIGHWYENRENVQQWQLYPVLELGWRDLLAHDRVPGFA
jgi:uncharacterized phiE125 gp8 family phage protein